MPSGPGIIDLKTIAEISKVTSSDIETFFLTSETHAEDIIAQHQVVKTSVVQLVDAVSTQDLRKLKTVLRGVKLVQVIHVRDESSIEEAKKVSPYVDMILLDSGNPNLQIKELGGTGQVHNWEFSERIVQEADTPVYLAGGITPSNVQEAVHHVQPHGVDLCSGVRTNDVLDQEKLDAFFREISILG